MKYDVFRERVLKSLSKYKENVLLCNQHGTYNGREYSHILPENRRQLNLLPTVKHPGRGFMCLKQSHHLNSSQMMCYNFFKPFIETEEGRGILLDILRQGMKVNIPEGSQIINDEDKGEYFFEYTQDQVERTKFDLFLKMSTGERIYVEAKYTEAEFGKTKKDESHPSMYIDKWNEVYKFHLKKSLYLKDISIDEFYGEYQLYRSASYIRGNKDYVILVFCYENEKIKKEAEEVLVGLEAKGCENMIMVDWKKLCIIGKNRCEGTRYYKHFDEFEEKYLNF